MAERRLQKRKIHGQAVKYGMRPKGLRTATNPSGGAKKASFTGRTGAGERHGGAGIAKECRNIANMLIFM